MRLRLAMLAMLAAFLSVTAARAQEKALGPLETGDFRWTASAPLVSPAERPSDPCQSIKDPTVVFDDGRWHLFCTIRSQKRSHQIEYLSFADWKDAGKAERHILTISDGYFCAPQVFYYSPHKKWYMILQVAEPSRKPSLQPAYSTTETIADPQSWSKPQLLFAEHPKSVSAWIDFWVICDDERAHLFFTSNNGLMWQCATTRGQFPAGWSEPRVVLKGDIFEASHTYRIRGQNKYLTLIEAQGQNGRRYYKAYLADKLDGDWTPLAATRDKPFAALNNVKDNDVSGRGNHWTDSFSHGELLRAGNDERLEVDPAKLRFLFQGVSDQRRAGKPYGQIPWELGLLEPAPLPPPSGKGPR